MTSLKEEFLEVLSKYQGILYKVSLIYFNSPADREDNLQEIIYQLWKSFPNIRNKGSIGSWIYAVSINTSISRVKKGSHIEYRENVPDVPDRSNFMDVMARNESLQLLLNAIFGLNEADKAIMLLYLEEKSYDEIAAIIGITNSNVGVRINRAKETLKHYFKNQNHGKQ